MVSEKALVVSECSKIFYYYFSNAITMMFISIDWRITITNIFINSVTVVFIEVKNLGMCDDQVTKYIVVISLFIFYFVWK